MNADEKKRLQYLMEKNGIEIDFEPSNELRQILEKLEDCGLLDKKEIAFFEEKGLFSFLARYYQNRWQIDFNNQQVTEGSYWNLINACKYLRMSKQAQKGLEITEDQSPSNPQVFSALLTTRGGAFRDVWKFSEALKCGIKAIELNETYHPHNLLGAIYYETGQPGIGDEHFQKAIELHASEKVIDRNILSAVLRAHPKNKAICIKHLLEKDPQRYEWANKIGSSQIGNISEYDTNMDFCLDETSVEMDEIYETHRGIMNELLEYEDNWERSREDGWFYDD